MAPAYSPTEESKLDSLAPRGRSSTVVVRPPLSSRQGRVSMVYEPKSAIQARFSSQPKKPSMQPRQLQTPSNPPRQARQRSATRAQRVSTLELNDIRDKFTSTKSRRNALYDFLDDPQSSNQAAAFSAFTNVVIFLSVAILVFGRKDSWCSRHSWISLLDDACCAVFSVELLLRLSVTTSSRELLDVFLLIDSISVLPCWLGWLRMLPCRKIGKLHTLSVLRLGKLAWKYEGSIIIWRAMRLSREALQVALFFLAISNTIFATFLFFAERQASADAEADAAFWSIPHAMWFMMVTMSTVGYGDVYPKTDAGKIVTVFGMVFGVLFISMPLAIVGNNFCIVWDDKERVVFVSKLRLQLDLRKIGMSELSAAFQLMDTDGSGLISFVEFRDALHMLGMKHQTGSHLALLWRSLTNGDGGEITLDDFLHIIYTNSPELVDEWRLKERRRTELFEVERLENVSHPMRVEARSTLREALVTLENVHLGSRELKQTQAAILASAKEMNNEQSLEEEEMDKIDLISTLILGQPRI